MNWDGGRRSRYNTDVGQNNVRKHRAEYLLVLLAGILSTVGLIVIYSISPAISALSGEDGMYYFSRHVIALIIGIAGMAIMYFISLKHVKLMAYLFGVLALLGSALILALDGVAYRWIKIGGLSFQPSEMMKLALLLWLGVFLADRIRTGSLNMGKKTLYPILGALGVFSLIVVVLQRDLGSMIVIAAIFGITLFIAGFPIKPLLILLISGVFLISVAIISTPYRRARFETFLNPERDCQVEGYHACQALIAVGSGGLGGLGVGNSVQAYGYLPETPTDSIFAIYAEKFGFIGSIFLIAIIGLLVFRLLRIAQRSTSWEHRLIITGIATWLGVQSVINVGAMIGLLPLKGITLPFISYGGSSLIFVYMALGVALRISCYTSMRTQQLEKGTNYEDNAVGRGNRRTYNTPLSSRSRNTSS